MSCGEMLAGREAPVRTLPVQTPNAIAGTWRTVRGPGTQSVPDALYDAAENAITEDQRIDGNPQVQATMAPSYVEFGREQFKFPIALLLASSRVVFARRKGMRRSAEVFNLFRYDFTQYSQPNVAPQQFDVRMDHERYGIIRVYFQTMSEAVELVEYCKSG